MLLTLTPNLCLERTLLIEDFAAGRVHRVPPQKLHLNAGGKGINAARVAVQLGQDVLATSWVGRLQTEWFNLQLRREGIPHHLVEVEADTRASINILDGCPQGGHHTPTCKTEIVEAGNPLQPDDLRRMTETIEQLLSRTSLFAICGSYPSTHGLEAEAIERQDQHLEEMVALAHRHAVKVLVDGKGPAFARVFGGLQKPWCIKPNLDEARELLKRTITTGEQEVRAVRDLVATGVAVVLLSCGHRGAYLGTEIGTWFLSSPAINEVSPVGSGDSMVGAFAAHYLSSGDVLEAARWGVAAGAANAGQVLPAFCTQTDIEELLPQVKVVEISAT